MRADLVVDSDQFTAQFLEAMVLIDFRLRLALGRGRRKRFGDGFPVHFSRESNFWIVSRVFGLGAVAGRFSAAASDGADRILAQIAENGELTKNLGALSGREFGGDLGQAQREVGGLR